MKQINKSWSKSTWAQCTICILGVLFIVVGAIIGNFLKQTNYFTMLNTILLSLGCSAISSVLVTHFRTKTEDVNLEDIHKSIYNIENIVNRFMLMSE